MEEDITLSVVMPAYNEGGHIKNNLLKTSRSLSGFIKRYEIIAVNDGSTDETETEIFKASKNDNHIRCISYSKNGGKGHAIRTGIEEAVGRYIAFLDADLEIPPELLKDFMRRMKNSDADIVIGSKLHPESKLEYPLSRKIMSYGYYLILKAMFHMNLHDTQSGIKMFKKEVIKPIAKDLVTEGYAFDIEILAKATECGFKIVEAPIEVIFSREKEEDGRRIGFKDIFSVFGETLRVKKILNKYGKGR